MRVSACNPFREELSSAIGGVIMSNSWSRLASVVMCLDCLQLGGAIAGGCGCFSQNEVAVILVVGIC